MMSRTPSRRWPSRPPRGGVIVLVLFMLTALLIISGLAINWVYLQTTRAELRVAADATSKAGLLMLSMTQNQAQARKVARQVANQHKVGGNPLQIKNRQISFGQAQETAQGYQFLAGKTPFNSCKVMLDSGDVDTVLAGFLGQSAFKVSQVSVSHRVDNDVCLVIDRSGSMGWDMSADTFAYPPDLGTSSPFQAYFTPPHPTNSRWAALVSGVDAFLEVLQQRDRRAHMAATTFASDYTFGNFSSQVTTVEAKLTQNFSQIRKALRTVGQTPVIGDTNIGAGMEVGQHLLRDTEGAHGARITSQKTLVVFTDGLKTEGPNPIAIASNFAQRGGHVHTITYSSGADQRLMQKVAAAGRGIHVHANKPRDLIRAFQIIADAIPTVLIDDE